MKILSKCSKCWFALIPVFLVAIAVIVILPFYLTNLKQLQENENIRINQLSNFPFIPFEEIQLSNSVPQYPSFIIKEKLIGKNSKGQEMRYFLFRNARLQDKDEISQYYLSELSINHWQIASDQKEICQSVNTLCRQWHRIVAYNKIQKLDFFIVSGEEFEITLTQGEESSALIDIPTDFPAELIPEKATINTFLRGFDNENHRITLLELNNLSVEDLHELLPNLEKEGWSENCGCASSPGFYNCGCSNQSASFMFNQWYKGYFDQDRTTLKVTENSE